MRQLGKQGSYKITTVQMKKNVRRIIHVKFKNRNGYEYLRLQQVHDAYYTAWALSKIDPGRRRVGGVLPDLAKPVVQRTNVVSSSPSLR